MSAFVHLPVLSREAPEALVARPDGLYVDGTFGRGGHSRLILERLAPQGRLIAFDRDPEAVAAAAAIKDPRFQIVHAPFSAMKERLGDLGIRQVDGIFLDIGVSSPQIDDPSRGFSFRFEGPLDMRMDRQQALSAWDVVNTWSREDIRHILFEYGEERYAPLIAAAIERERGKKPIETTLELVDIIRGAMPAKALREKQHPAKRSFQAIRIAVNDELGAVREAMEKAIDCLNPGGRLAVITFHSLEDRIVKAAFNQAAQGCTCPKDFPVCVCGKKPKVRLTPRKPILPSDEEIEENPRARSAKLRVCEKI